MSRPEKVQPPKRYNLALPQPVYDEIKEVADARHSPVLEIMKLLLTIGLTVVRAKERGAVFVIREGMREREIIIP